MMLTVAWLFPPYSEQKGHSKKGCSLVLCQATHMPLWKAWLLLMDLFINSANVDWVPSVCQEPHYIREIIGNWTWYQTAGLTCLWEASVGGTKAQSPSQSPDLETVSQPTAVALRGGLAQTPVSLLFPGSQLYHLWNGGDQSPHSPLHWLGNMGLQCSHSLLFFKIIFKIYLFLTALGLYCGVRASLCGGFSCCGAQALGSVSFSSCGTRA